MLRSFREAVPDWVPLVAVTALALAVRVVGNRFGLPDRYHPDEDMLIRIATTMASGGDLNPHFFHWGGGHFYVTALVLRGAEALGWPQSEADAYFVARTLSGVMGAATVLLTMLVARQLYRNRTITFLTGLIFSLTMLHVRSSHYATVDVPGTFWLALALWLFVVAMHQPRTRLLLLIAAGLASGLATGTKYHLGIIVPVLAGGAWMASARTEARSSLEWLGVLAGAALGFLLSNPYAVLDYPAFSSGVRELLTHYDRPEMHPRNHSDNNWIFFIRTLAGGESGVFFLLAGVLGAVILLAEERRTEMLLLAGFPIASFVYLGSKNASFVRNLMPLVVFMAVAAAVGMERLMRSSARWHQAARIAVVAGLTIGMVMELTRVVQFDRLLQGPDTRALASQWLSQHLAPGDVVAVEREAWANPSLPAGVQSGRMILPEYTAASLVERGFGYVITNSVSYRAFFVYPELGPDARVAYERLFNDLDQHATLMATFAGEAAPVPVNDELPNPEIRIYRLAR